jgi:hypothetical protein
MTNIQKAMMDKRSTKMKQTLKIRRIKENHLNKEDIISGDNEDYNKNNTFTQKQQIP